MLRGVLLDREDHLFYNFSSIQLKVESRDTSLGRVERMHDSLIEEI